MSVMLMYFTQQDHLGCGAPAQAVCCSPACMHHACTLMHTQLSTPDPVRRNHRGLRHYWGLRVKGQHSKTTGRRGRTVGVSKKKG